MRKSLLLACALCALAVSIRAHTLRSVPDTVWFGTENERVAAALAAGRGWSDAYGEGTGPTAHLAPLYPLLLSGSYRLFGTYETVRGRQAQQVLSVILTTASLLLLPVLAHRLGFTPAAGWAAAFLAAWLPANRWTEALGHHDQVAAAPCLLLMLWALAGLSRSGWSGRWAVAATGALIGVTALLAPSLLLVPVLFFLTELVCRCDERLRLLRAGALLTAAAVVLVAPWAVRNAVVLGSPIPLRSNFGLELAVGNRPGADGRTYAAGFADIHPFGSAAERQRLAEMGEVAYMRDKQRQALTWIAESPLTFAHLTARRARFFWFTPDDRWYSPDFRLRLESRVYGIIGIGAALELLRLLTLGRTAGRLLTCAMVGAAVPFLITHVEMRYRLPIVGLSALLCMNLAATLFGWSLCQLRRARPSSRELLRAARAA